MIKCPNKTLPEWKKLVKVVGENKAHYLWDQNNGYGLDKTPNGQPSKLFSDLLSLYQGDRNAAIQAKAKVYSEAFKNWFGDWVNVGNNIDYNFFGEYADNNTTNGKLIRILLDNYVSPSDISEIVYNKFGTSGSYITDTKQLTIPTDESEPLHTRRKVVAHELMHVATAKYCDAYIYLKDGLTRYNVSDSYIKNLPKLTEEQIKSFDRLSEIKQQVVDYINNNPEEVDQIRKKYGDEFGVVSYFTVDPENYNLHEFLSEAFTNPALIEVMSQIKTGSNKLSIFDKFVNALSKIFGFDISSTLFGETVNEISKILRNKNSVSKVVDENGEPLIVYHHANNQFSEFSVEFDNYFSTVKGGTKKALFFTGTQNPASGTVLDRPYKMPVFLNAKNIISKTGTKDELAASGEGFVSTINRAAEEADAAIFHGIDDNQEVNQDIYVINNPNNVKSIDNIGTFSTQNDNIYYKRGEQSGVYDTDIMQEIGDFSTTAQLIDYLVRQKGISKHTRNLLFALRKHSTSLIIRDHSRDGELAYYDGAINLNVDRLQSASIQEIAEDTAHEMLHHYLNKYYDENQEFQKYVQTLQEKYRKYFPGKEKPYGLNKDESAIEFLNEFMSNRRLRMELKFRQGNLFTDFINRIISIVRKLFTGKKTQVGSLQFQEDLKQLENTVYRLLDDVNTANLDTYTVDNHPYTIEYKLSGNQLDEVNKTYSRIQQGLKNRLKSVKRYATKNPKLWTVINQLANSEAEQGMLQFLQHVSDTIGEASLFLQKPISQINAKQIRQLSQDYVGFYKPLLDEIIYLTDTTDLFKTLPNYNDLVSNMQVLSTQMNQIYNRFNNILKSKGKSELQAYLQQNGMPQEYIDKTMQWLDDPAVDSSVFLNWFGMASNSDNAVLQAIAKLLNDTMNGTERETMAKGIELVKIVQEAKEKYGVDIQKLLYETLDDGTYSGYIVKPINYGQYKKDKAEYLDKVAAELGITKDEDGYYDIPADDDIQQKWYEAVNKFYSEKVNRRFTPEYYKLRNEYLSNKTRQAIDEIQDYIYSIISSVTRDGIVYENELTDSEYNQLLELRKQKRLLANPYNLDGSVKTGTAGEIAEELREFSEVVGEQDYDTDWDRYNRDLQKVITRYGSKDDPRVKLWIARNTRTRFTQEFYDRLDALNNVEQTQLYEDLIERRRLFRQLFSNPETGQITAERLSDNERALLLQLDKDISAERTVSNEKRSEETDNFKLFAEVVYTDEYYRDYKQAQNAGQQAFDDWYWKNHYENAYGVVVPASYYTQLQPKDLDKYSEIVPTGRYSTIDASSKWFNKDFDQSGPAVQPKKEFYDNSKAYKAVINKPEVKALYEAIERTIQEANSFIPFLNNLDDGRMPQMPARLTQVWNRQSGIMQRLGYVWDEVATTQADDLDYVEDEGTMPNGDPIKLIPTRFIKMLKNPNIISTDAVSAVVAYYHMATNFKNMQQNQDQIELLLNLLRNVQIRNRRGIKPAGSSNIYKQAQLLVDRLMYGKNMTPILWKVGDKEINVSKVATNILNFVRKVNLSGNIWSIATSFFTDSTYTTMEAMLGRFFDADDLRFAVAEFEKQLPDMMANIGNPNPKGKLPYLLQLNQVVKSNQEIFNRLDQSQVLRSINQNFWYAGYTQSDYIVKSHTLISIYHNYKLVDGKFLSKNEYLNQYYPNDRKAGKVAFKQLKTTLYDAYNEDGSIKKEYEKAITTQLLNKVKNRIDVLSRRIDGTLREVDKAAVHAHALAQYIVLHKNFMISGLHDRFKKKQFNLDTGMEEDGYYRATASFLKGIAGNRHFALKEILADYDQLKDYEQYAIRRVLYDMMLIVASTTLALSIAALVDGDDDYDNWVMQSITYLALRSAFEFRTMYNPFEFMSMIKSPTAAFTWFDNASSFINLFNPFSYIGKGGPFKIIDRGVYEGMPRILRNMIKVTPIRSIIEAADPESKRSYLQNQLMTF